MKNNEKKGRNLRTGGIGEKGRSWGRGEIREEEEKERADLDKEEEDE